MAVNALEHEEAYELTLKLLGHDDPLAQFQARMIARESRGSPFFVYELVEHLQAGGELEDRSSIRGSISLDDVLWARIERLPEGARALVEVLSVAGQPLRQADTIRAAGLGPEGFTALASLRANHLIRGTGAGALDDVETYHDRIRETVVNHLEADRLRDLHERLAVTLDESGRGDAQALAVHFDGAGRPEKAGEYYVRAAREASQALAFDHAARLFRRALELSRSADEEHTLRRELARALADAGRSLEAAQEYARACEAAGPDEIQELRRALAFQLLMSGRIDEGMGVYRELLAHLGLRMPATPQQLLREMIVTRLILRVRGLKFRERRADEIAPDVLERLDTAQAVALGMSVVDWIRGSSFQSRSLLMALRAGEPVRVALSMGWEIVMSACIGRRALPPHRPAHRAVACPGRPAGRSPRHRHGAAGPRRREFPLLAVPRGRRTSATRPTRSCASAAPAPSGSSTPRRCSPPGRCSIAARSTSCGSDAPGSRREGRERGDMYLEATVNQFPRVVTFLADDDPDQARQHALESIAKWSQQGFHVQHLTSFFGQMLIDLYKGDGRGAWHRMASTWPVLEKSLLNKIQHVYIDALQYNGRSALAAARQGEPAGPLLKHAERTARILDRQGLNWADAFAAQPPRRHRLAPGRRGRRRGAAPPGDRRLRRGRPQPLRRLGPPPARRTPGRRRREGPDRPLRRLDGRPGHPRPREDGPCLRVGISGARVVTPQFGLTTAPVEGIRPRVTIGRPHTPGFYETAEEFRAMRRPCRSSAIARRDPGASR